MSDTDPSEHGHLHKRRWAFGLFLYFLVLMVAVAPFMPSHWSNDSRTIAEFADRLQNTGSEGIDRSYYFSTLLFISLGPMGYVFLALVAALYCASFAAALQTGKSAVASTIFLSPAFLLGLVRPQKEVFVFALCGLLCVRQRFFRSDLLFIALGYSAYSGLMRPYFLGIFAIFVLIKACERLGPLAWPVFFLVCALVIALLPHEILVQLQGSRDYINLSARGIDDEQRTAFVNPRPEIDGLIDFCINYAYAFSILNFSFAWFFDASSIVLTLTCLAYFWLIYNGSRATDSFYRTRSKLFLAHLLFLPLIEPDIGSYFRHISAVVIFLAGSIAPATESILGRRLKAT